ncbi:phage tail protein [Magnetospirillum molischianum]|uniref:Microcystin dependent protein n=1 Tax=Magnetospirillum molischianum DSM 120 TaxID=1150626 RepID=H8FQE0_MAGML|nr:tail fiber protein [Magnetospirillum molischianum]CCG40578.1 Microcystin dependent protein [Magnetospirillum molischianum DSM 120]
MAEFYVGEIRLFAFDQYAPANFLPCDGRTLKVADYPALFSLIGTLYGGDGTTDFKIPDLRGRSPVHYGQLTGGSNYLLAQAAGAEQVQLTSEMVPPHNHIVSVTKAAATTMVPAANNAPGDVGSNFYYCNEDQAGALFKTAGDTVTVSGGGDQKHLNIQTSLILSYAIAVNGLYPDLNN